MDLDLVEVLYNSTYGGFCFSDEFIDECHKRGLKEITRHDISIETRTNPICLEVYYMLGSERSGRRGTTLLDTFKIPREFLSVVDIDEYDGAETIIINFDKYWSNMLKKYFADDSMSKQALRDLCIKKTEIWEEYKKMSI